MAKMYYVVLGNWAVESKEGRWRVSDQRNTCWLKQSINDIPYRLVTFFCMLSSFLDSMGPVLRIIFHENLDATGF